MHISHVRVRNYRNFLDLEVALGERAVIVGENAVGKSNLLCALGLILDATLPDSARELRDEDFWDGYVSPRADGVSVRVTVELTGFDTQSEADRRARALLADFLVNRTPYAASLSYVYRPRADLTHPPAAPADYEFLVYGGHNESMRVDHATRRRLGFEVFRALRDAERSLANWRQSPLRPLLTEVLRGMPRERLQGYAGTVDSAAQQLTDAPEIKALADRSTERVARMVGNTHAMQTTLGLAPSDPDSLFRSLRLFLDERLRDVSQASIGSANVLFLALVALGIEQATATGERVHTILGIEEPEAHLHPHLQRLVYRDFLRRREHQETSTAQNGEASPARGENIRVENAVLSKILTTHSPHIVSVTPVRSLAVLRRALAPAPAAGAMESTATSAPQAAVQPPKTSTGEPSSVISVWVPPASPARRAGAATTVGRSAATLALDLDEVADLERYLDVSRGEFLFARGLVLVEGEAETYLVPALAAHCGYDLDQLGISVCSIAGTHFIPFLKLVGEQGLDIPTVVLTDWDPVGAPSSPEDEAPESEGRDAAVSAPEGTARETDQDPEATVTTGVELSAGARRIVGILRALGVTDALDANDAERIRAAGRAHGIFSNEHTLEVDLFKAGNGLVLGSVLAECGAGRPTVARVTGWATAPSTLDAVKLLGSIERFGKGRVAQCMARRLAIAAHDAPTSGIVPPYVVDALAHLVAQLPTAPGS